MEKELIEEDPWKVKAGRRRTTVVTRVNYWRNRQAEMKQQEMERLRENQYDYSWKEYTSTGESWENDYW